MYTLFNSCFKIKPTLNEHMLIYIRYNNLIISNENTYTITLIMNECIRYINQNYYDKVSNEKYSIAIQCMYDILHDKLTENELKNIMNLIKVCVFIHYDK